MNYYIVALRAGYMAVGWYLKASMAGRVTEAEVLAFGKSLVDEVGQAMGAKIKVVPAVEVKPAPDLGEAGK